jgi:hypothetical protein
MFAESLNAQQMKNVLSTSRAQMRNVWIPARVRQMQIVSSETIELDVSVLRVTRVIRTAQDVP